MPLESSKTSHYVTLRFKILNRTLKGLELPSSVLALFHSGPQVLKKFCPPPKTSYMVTLLPRRSSPITCLYMLLIYISLPNKKSYFDTAIILHASPRSPFQRQHKLLGVLAANSLELHLSLEMVIYRRLHHTFSTWVHYFYHFSPTVT